MSLALASRRAAISPAWVKNPLWRTARAVPSLDQPFADTKSLTDAVTGQSLVTFTRASSGTSVGSDGLIKTATTNLLLRSEEFDNASWTKQQSSISSNVTTAPNGTLTADKLIEDSSNNIHTAYVFPTGLRAASALTFSVYAKSSERTSFALDVRSVGNGFRAVFDLSAQTAIGAAVGSGTLIGAGIQSMGNGWFRCFVTGSHPTDTSLNTTIRLNNPAGTDTYTGDGTSGLFLWGAQLEQSSTVGEYIPTTSTINSAPRFDHNPTTGESLGLLVEEQRTNSIRNNTMVGAAAGTPGTNPTNWPYVTTQSNGLSQSVVGTGTENGIAYIDYRFFGTTITSPASIAFGFESIAAAVSGQTWTSSIFLKLVSGTTTGITNFQLGLIENNSGGSFVGGALYNIATPTNANLATQRPSATRTLIAATTAFCGPTMGINVAGSTAIDFTLRVGMPQLEQGAFATSVIPTTTAAATRSADVASITGANFSSWYRQDEGTVYWEGNPFASIETGYFGVQDSGSTSHIRISRSFNQARALVTTSSSTQADIYSGNFITLGAGNKIALATKANDFALSLAGATVVTDTSGTMPAVDRATIGIGAFLPQMNGTIRRLTYWPARLSNSTLQAITQ